jgi:hypothetical protein
MEMKGERQLPVERAAAWTMLNDSEFLKSCIPGCESITAVSDHSYDIVMNAAIGPVKARFKGKMAMTDIDPPRSYRLAFDGQSTQAGFARGTADIRLEELGPGSTKLVYAATAQVGGKLAQVGSRLVDAAAAATADKFFEAFAAQITARSAGATPGATALPPPGQPGFWSWLVSFLRYLFGRR